MTLETRIAEVRFDMGVPAHAVIIINELTDKLAKVRHLINEAGEMASQDGAVAIMLVLNEALKLTDIEQEQPE